MFSSAAQAQASDVHIAVDHPVIFRIDGVLVEQDQEKLGAEDTKGFVEAVLGAENFKKLQEDWEIDVSYQVKDGLRLRVNCHYEKGNLSLAARIIPTKIPTLEEVGFDERMKGMCSLNEGLVLFTGPTGAGKSTSLAAMIQHINESHSKNIVTMEDPIEFLFPPGKSIIRQRQLGEDFHSFPEALKRVLRQDPNIIMVGEMRDIETVSAALTLAETGHLIFATLHTPNSVQAINRIIDMFPAHQQPQIRSQLSLSLKAVVAQRLLPKEGGGRVALRECLVNTPATANIIRENRLQELSSVLQSGKKDGMCTFAQAAERLHDEGHISKDVVETVE